MDDREIMKGDKLVLRGLKFHGFHGVKPEEKTLGQKFLVDVDAWMDLRPAGISDQISDTVSYSDIYRIVGEVLQGPPHNLLESVAELIASTTLTKYPLISAIRVKVGKPHVAVPGSLDYLGVEILRYREPNAVLNKLLGRFSSRRDEAESSSGIAVEDTVSTSGVRSEQAGLQRSVSVRVDVGSNSQRKSRKRSTTERSRPQAVPEIILSQQGQHISEHIDDPTVMLIKVRRGGKLPPVAHPAILEGLTRAGFYGFDFVARESVDHSLVQALVERWRPETHTFHLPVGEATITLQDVEVIAGLPVEGVPITGTICAPLDYDGSWSVYLEALTGYDATADGSIKDNKVHFAALRDHYIMILGDDRWLEHTYTIDQVTRCYVLLLLGVLFSDTDGQMISLGLLPHVEDLDACGRLSWGSAALAHLFRQMCLYSLGRITNFSGPVMILQIWAYSRLVCVRPHVMRTGRRRPDPLPEVNLLPRPYGWKWTRGAFSGKYNLTHNISILRQSLDLMRDDQMVWDPYVRDMHPKYSYGFYRSWMATVPLIFYAVVEWHRPERCLRQFGKAQDPLPPPEQHEYLHTVTTKGKTPASGPKDWAQIHGEYVRMWLTRQPVQGTRTFTAASWTVYQQWYRARTRMVIEPMVPQESQEPDKYRLCRGR